jgi:hypothetical protein
MVVCAKLFKGRRNIAKVSALEQELGSQSSSTFLLTHFLPIQIPTPLTGWSVD